METWVIEKSVKSLRSLSRAVDLLNRNKDKISNDLFDDLTSELWTAIVYEITVIFHLKKAENWDSNSITEEIVEKGELGLDQHLQKHTIIIDSELLRKERDRIRREEERPQFALGIFELSQREIQDSRREIYEECERFGNDKLTKEIFDLIEGVTLGTKPWSQFQREIVLVLSPYLEVTKLG